MFALQTLCTTQFLFSFFAAEIPWISMFFSDYLTFLKVFLCTGAIFTIYFQALFVLLSFTTDRHDKDNGVSK